jgi:uncharacterized protein (TIRG00374 family)
MGHFFHTVTWKTIFSEIGVEVKLWFLFKIKLMGETVNILVPLGMGAGDPFRALSLKNHFPLSKITASIILERTIYFTISLVNIFICLVLLFSKTELHTELKIIFFSISIAMALFLVVFFLKQKKNLLTNLLNSLEKLHLIEIKKYWKEKAAETDTILSAYYHKDRKNFLLCAAYSFIGRMCGTFEIYSIMVILDFDCTFLDAYLIHAVTQVVNLGFNFIPGALGVMEGAYGFIFLLLGLNPTDGIILQIIRRIRMFILIALGLSLSLFSRTKRN